MPWAVASILLALPVPKPATPPAPLPDLGDTVSRAIRDLGLQTDLPKVTPPVDLPSFDIPDWVMWVLVILGFAFLVYCLWDYLPIVGGRRRGEWGEPEPELGPDGVELPRHLALAEALAAEGRFVEAMHEVLLGALAEIRARRAEALADSLTSREILRRAPLPDLGKASLREIIQRVEWTYFGEHPAGEADYRACRGSYDELRAALQGAR